MDNAPAIHSPSALALFEGNNLERMLTAADKLARSGVVPDTLKGKPEAVFAILCMGAELGLPPMLAINTINVIQGKPTQSAQLIVGRVLQKFPNALFKIVQDEKNLVVKVYAGRPGTDIKDAYVATWDMAKAGAMGLTGKDNYKRQPITMLRARATSEAARAVFPDVVMGLYATEEFQDFDGKEVRKVDNLMGDDDHLDRRTAEQREVGHPEYVVGQGKFRGVALKDADPEQLAEYEETLMDRSKKGGLKPWESEVMTSIRLFLARMEKGETVAPAHQDVIIEALPTAAGPDLGDFRPNVGKFKNVRLADAPRAELQGYVAYCRKTYTDMQGDLKEAVEAIEKFLGVA